MMRNLALLAATLLLAACAVQVPAVVEPGAPGFLLGLVHGFIIIFSFIGSLFSDTISIYAVPNSGGWYNFGYALGAGAFTGGGGILSRK
jgi:opacity protein-like surface antigen